MSQTRQSGDDEGFLIRSLGLGLPNGSAIAPHAHAWHQLIYATDGVMTVDTPLGSWVVPPHRAVWIPALSTHSVRTTGRVWMRTLYVRPDLSGDRPGTCVAIDVTPLLRELVLEVMRIGMMRNDDPRHRRLALVIIDQITASRAAPLQLVLPTDPRARTVADVVQADLSIMPSLSVLSRGCGASPRTIERVFLKETGLSFGRWRQRAKVLHALERLAGGESVAAAALAVGYDSTSAFITMFKRVIGTTPGAYFRTHSTADRTAMDGRHRVRGADDRR